MLSDFLLRTWPYFIFLKIINNNIEMINQLLDFGFLPFDSNYKNVT